MIPFNKILAIAFLAASFCAAPAMAAGDGSTSTEIKCTGGKVLDQKTKKCVDPQESKLDTESLYQAGSALAKAGRFGEAISVLSLAVDRGDPRVFNYLGYSHRMQGRVVVGLGYYQEALAINPDFVLAREYMGEAYLQLGDVAAARGQLDEIARRCGTGCKEYTALDGAIRKAQAEQEASNGAVDLPQPASYQLATLPVDRICCYVICKCFNPRL